MRDAGVALAVAACWWLAMEYALALGWQPFRPRLQLTAGLWTAGLLVAGHRWPRTAFLATAVCYPLVLDPGLVVRVLDPSLGVLGGLRLGMLSAAQGGVLDLPLLLAAYQVTASGLLRTRWVLPVLVAGVLLLTASPLDLLPGRDADLFSQGGTDLSELVFALMLAVGCALLGRAEAGRRRVAQELRSRNAELERLRLVEAREVVTAERTRIARELHDVVAHHVIAIVIRAQAADRVADERPGAPLEAVRWIAGAGQEALTSMRQVVQVLRTRGDGGPDARAPLAPGAALAELSDVAARVREAGLPVELQLPELPGLPALVEQAALRITQESLTNVLLHAVATRAVVHVRLSAGALVLTVDDDGRAGPPTRDPFAPQPGTGRVGNGLVGMRERAASFGGVVTAGPSPLGGWQITAVLPVAAHGAAAPDAVAASTGWTS